MRQILLNSEEISWLLGHVDFRTNDSLYRKLQSSVRSKEALVNGGELFVIETKGEKAKVSETYGLGDAVASDEPIMGFVTDEQYFTDPSLKKIHFSELGFCFFTDWKKIFILNRETSEVQPTSYEFIKSEDNEINLNTDTPFLRLGSEFYWNHSMGGDSHIQRVSEARESLGLKENQWICPKCYSEVLTEVETDPGKSQLGCEICELLFEEKSYGLVNSR